MPEITGLRERKGRARVFIDGDFWAEIDAGVAAERGLWEGTELSHEELQEVRIEGERPLAMSRALNLLGYRPRSVAELDQRLRRYGYASETVEVVIWRLQELGYLNDEEYARTLAWEKARKYGPRRVYSDLRKGGIADATARSIVDEEFTSRSEVEAAFEAASRRYNVEESSDAQARRVYGFLVRRGYSVEVCAEVARGYRGS